jgi:hypothetical protein
MANEIALHLSYRPQGGAVNNTTTLGHDASRYQLTTGHNNSQVLDASCNYQMKLNADELLRKRSANGLYDLLMHQVQKAESLMQDNALLQRTIYKYENTVSEISHIYSGQGDVKE